MALGHILGGLANPAVTLSICLSRKTSVVRGLLYLIVQLLGGMDAAGILYGVVLTVDQSTVGMVTKNPMITDAQAFGVEVMTTFALIMAIQGMTDSNKTNVYGAAPLGIGLTVTANILFGRWLSGGCMNPARALGPMVVGDPTSEDWAYHWIYWVGHLLGSMLAAALYQLLFRQPPPVTSSENTDQFLHRVQKTVYPQ